MRPRAVAVAHRDAMVAEGIAAALDRYPGIAPIAVTTSAEDVVRYADRADSVAIDGRLPGAAGAARRMRRRGVRVVILGEGAAGDGGARVPQRAPIADLAVALAPELLSARPSADGLTAREKEILGLVAEGFAAKQVARHLGISPKTVERHKTRIYAKLGAPNQAAAVHLAFGGGAGGTQAWASKSS
jgi:DNA-binding NarL/FixJ family response regulator